jgi:tRNA1Val (adenine37-N6)-methyltransferase
MGKNTYFRFKQFNIHQDRTAMKVCTDSCLFGAMIDVGLSHQILDIGTGTGLLSLMIAQRSQAQIDAVEIQAEAFQQATDNVKASPWEDRILVIHGAIQTFALNREKKYDLILSNPPFFENHLKSAHQHTNLALHNEELSPDELLKAVSNLLKDDGTFWVMLPLYQAQVLAEKAKFYTLACLNRIEVYNFAEKDIFRLIQVFGRGIETEISLRKFTIYEQDKTYTQEFRELLKDYYLIF